MKKDQNTKNLPSRAAGRLMTTRVPLAFEEQTLTEVQNLLFQKTPQYDSINYIYVVDKGKKLTGVFSVKEIFRKPKEAKVGEIMQKEVVKAHVSTHQERVAALALQHNLKAIPIVDKDEQFLGVVTSDTILRVLHQEHIEDILVAGGIGKDSSRIKEFLTAKPSVLVKARLPWLIIGLLGGVLAAQIVGFFEQTLQSQMLLALFIPLIVYISDAVATQTETLIIRGIALDHELNLKKYFLREIKIGALLALILAVLLVVITATFWCSLSLSMILGLAMFFGIFFSVIVATLIPLLLQKFKKDPALGSGPFATIITDLSSIVIYFLTATILLKIF